MKEVEAYQQQLLKFIESRVDSKQDAEDILASVWLKFISQEKAPPNPIAWLYRVTSNSIIDYYRRSKQVTEIPNNLIEEIEEKTAFEELSACLLPFINTLNDEFQSAIQLVDIEGHSQKSAASTLAISLPALKSRLLRGRKKLHDKFKQCCPPINNKSGRIVEFDQTNNNCGNC